MLTAVTRQNKLREKTKYKGPNKKAQHLKQRGSLALLVSTNLKVLASLNGVLRHMLARLAL